MASVRDGRLEAAWLSQREAGGTETQRDSWGTSHVGGQKHSVLEQPTPCGTPVWIPSLAGSVWKILQALPEPPAPRCRWTTFAQNLHWGFHLTPTLKGGGLLPPGSAPSSQAPPARPAGLRGVGCSQVGLASLHCKPPGRQDLDAHFSDPVGVGRCHRAGPVSPQPLQRCTAPGGRRSLRLVGGAGRGQFPGSAGKVCRSLTEVLGQRLQPSLLEAEAIKDSRSVLPHPAPLLSTARAHTQNFALVPGPVAPPPRLSWEVLAAFGTWWGRQRA